MSDATLPQAPGFPQDAGQLRNAKLCPACFTPTHGATVCVHCELELDDSRLSDVFQQSLIAASALEARQFALTEILQQQHQHRIATVAAAPDTTDPVASEFSVPEFAAPLETAGPDTAPPGVPHDTSPVTPDPHLSPPTAQPLPQVEGRHDALPGPTLSAADLPQPTPGLPQLTNAADTAPPITPTQAAPAETAHGPAETPPVEQPQRRRSGVQLTLLGVGITFLAVAAAVFLTVAFFMFSLAIKAIIVAGITGAIIALASVLERRKLNASAEGVAVLAVVLLYLDAWAARATNLADLANWNPAAYWGVAGLLIGGANFLWSARTTLRVPQLSASLTILPSLALLIGGITNVVTTQAPAVLIGSSLAAASADLLLRVWPRATQDALFTWSVITTTVALGTIAFTAPSAGINPIVPLLCLAAAGISVLTLPLLPVPSSNPVLVQTLRVTCAVLAIALIGRALLEGLTPTVEALTPEIASGVPQSTMHLITALGNASACTIAAAVSVTLALIIQLRHQRRHDHDPHGLLVPIQIIAAISMLITIGISFFGLVLRAPQPYGAPTLLNGVGFWWHAISTAVVALIATAGAVLASRPFGSTLIRQTRTVWSLVATALMVTAAVNLPAPTNTWMLVAVTLMALTMLAVQRLKGAGTTTSLTAVGVTMPLAMIASGIGSPLSVILPAGASATLLAARHLRPASNAPATTAIAAIAAAAAYVVQIAHPAPHDVLEAMALFALPSVLAVIATVRRSFGGAVGERLLIAATAFTGVIVSVLYTYNFVANIRLAALAIMTFALLAVVELVLLWRCYRMPGPDQTVAQVIAPIAPIALSIMPLLGEVIAPSEWQTLDASLLLSALMAATGLVAIAIRRSAFQRIITAPAEVVGSLIAVSAAIVAIAASAATPYPPQHPLWIITTLLMSATICTSHFYRASNLAAVNVHLTSGTPAATPTTPPVSVIPWISGAALAVLAYAGVNVHDNTATMLAQSWGVIAVGIIATITQLAVHSRFKHASQVFATTAIGTVIYTLCCFLYDWHSYRYAPQLFGALAVLAFFGSTLLPKRPLFAPARVFGPAILAPFIVAGVATAVSLWPATEHDTIRANLSNDIPHLAWALPAAALLLALPTLLTRLRGMSTVTTTQRYMLYGSFMLSRIVGYITVVVLASNAESATFGSVALAVLALATVVVMNRDAAQLGLAKTVAVSTSVIAIAVPFAGFLYDQNATATEVIYGYAAPLVAIAGAGIAAFAIRRRLEPAMIIPLVCFTAVVPLLIPAIVNNMWATLMFASGVAVATATFLVARRARPPQHARTLAIFSIAYPVYALATQAPHDVLGTVPVITVLLAVALSVILLTFALTMTRHMRVGSRLGSVAVVMVGILVLSYQEELVAQPHVPVVYAAAALTLLIGVIAWLLIDNKTPQYVYEPHIIAITTPIVVGICAIAQAPDDRLWGYVVANSGFAMVIAIAGVAAYGFTTFPRLRDTAVSFAVGLGSFSTIAGLMSLSVDPNLADLRYWLPLSTTLFIGGALTNRVHRQRYVPTQREQLHPRARLNSWVFYGPGSILLAIIALLFQAIEMTTWRIGIATVVAAGLLVFGAVARLQAPFTVGLIASGMHLFVLWRRFIPDYAVPWWAWLAIAGTVLVSFAITYEARMRDLRKMWLGYKSLR